LDAARHGRRGIAIGIIGIIDGACAVLHEADLIKICRAGVIEVEKGNRDGVYISVVGIGGEAARGVLPVGEPLVKRERVMFGGIFILNGHFHEKHAAWAVGLRRALGPARKGEALGRGGAIARLVFVSDILVNGIHGLACHVHGGACTQLEGFAEEGVRVDGGCGDGRADIVDPILGIAILKVPVLQHVEFCRTEACGQHEVIQQDIAARFGRTLDIDLNKAVARDGGRELHRILMVAARGVDLVDRRCLVCQGIRI